MIGDQLRLEVAHRKVAAPSPAGRVEVARRKHPTWWAGVSALPPSIQISLKYLPAPAARVKAAAGRHRVASIAAARHRRSRLAYLIS